MGQAVHHRGRQAKRWGPPTRLSRLARGQEGRPRGRQATRWVLQHASPALRGDKEIVLEAVKQHGWALQYACPALQGDKDVVTEAVMEFPYALEYASPALRLDKSFSWVPRQPNAVPSHRPAKIVQAGALGNLRFRHTEHSWAVELGQALADLEHLSHPGRTLPKKPHNKAYVRSVISKHLYYHLADGGGWNYLDEMEKGGELLPFQLMAVVVRRVSRLGTACAFLRIGFAARLLELASVSLNLDLGQKYQQKARSSIHIISYECDGVQLNAGALYRLLAEPHSDDTSIWDNVRRASQPLVIMFIEADPIAAERVDLSGDFENLQETVNAAVVHNSLTVVPFPGGRFSQLSRYLANQQPVVLHFSGHGTERGFWFGDDEGGVAEIDPQAFAELLAQYQQRGLTGVVMNSCYTPLQAQVLADATGHAIVMDGMLSDRGAIAFTQQFYGSLGDGETFEEAFTLAVAVTNLDPEMRTLNPKLFKRSGDNTQTV